MKEITEEELMEILNRSLAIKGSLYGPVVSYASKKRAVDAVTGLIQKKKSEKP